MNQEMKVKILSFEQQVADFSTVRQCLHKSVGKNEYNRLRNNYLRATELNVNWLVILGKSPF